MENITNSIMEKTLKNALSVNNITSENQVRALNFIIEQYQDIYRIAARGIGLIINDYETEMELFPEFDQVSCQIVSFDGWVMIRDNDKSGYMKWEVGEIELKPLFSRVGLIHTIKGTISWHEKSPYCDGIRPISARLKYELPTGRICGFVPSFIGDSRIFEDAKVEYRSSDFNMEFGV